MIDYKLLNADYTILNRKDKLQIYQNSGRSQRPQALRGAGFGISASLDFFRKTVSKNINFSTQYT